MSNDEDARCIRRRMSPADNVTMTDTAENGLPLAPITLAEDVAQVVLLRPTFDWMQAQLRARGLYLFPIPVGEDDPPTFGIGVGETAMSRPTPPGGDA